MENEVNNKDEKKDDQHNKNGLIKFETELIELIWKMPNDMLLSEFVKTPEYIQFQNKYEEFIKQNS